jgi:hypothetical protein
LYEFVQKAWNHSLYRRFLRLAEPNGDRLRREASARKGLTHRVPSMRQALVFTPKQNRRILEAGVMFDQQGLIDTLRTTSALLLEMRKSIAASGNLDAMQEIDTLLAVAQSETDRGLVDAASRRSSSSAA